MAYKGNAFDVHKSTSKPITVTVVGDAESGKTSMLMTCIGAPFPKKSVPGACNFQGAIVIKDELYLELGSEPVHVSLNDTAAKKPGDNDMRRLKAVSQRTAVYKDTDVFILAFSLDSKSALQHIKSKWLPEVRMHCPDTPCLLIGCKSDLRGDGVRTMKGSKLVSPGSAMKMAMTLQCAPVPRCGAHTYLECSAKENLGLQNIMEAAIWAATDARKRKKKGGGALGCCTVL